jgi:hypothetical protein
VSSISSTSAGRCTLHGIPRASTPAVHGHPEYGLLEDELLLRFKIRPMNGHIRFAKTRCSCENHIYTNNINEDVENGA